MVYWLYKIKATICELLLKPRFQLLENCPADWYLLTRDEIAIGNPGDSLFIREYYVYGVGKGWRNWWTILEDSARVPFLTEKNHAGE